VTAAAAAVATAAAAAAAAGVKSAAGVPVVAATKNQRPGYDQPATLLCTAEAEAKAATADLSTGVVLIPAAAADEVEVPVLQAVQDEHR